MPSASRSVFAALAVLTVAVPLAHGSCPRAEVKAVGKAEAGRFRCQATVAATGDSSGLSACETKVMAKFAATFTKVLLTCPGDQMRCEGYVDACVVAITAVLDEPFPSACEAAKRRAAGTLAKAQLRCFLTTSSERFGACLGRALTRFQAQLNRAGSCPDGGSPQDDVWWKCVAPVVASYPVNDVCDPTTTTTTTSSTTTTSTTTTTTSTATTNSTSDVETTSTTAIIPTTTSTTIPVTVCCAGPAPGCSTVDVETCTILGGSVGAPGATCDINSGTCMAPREAWFFGDSNTGLIFDAFVDLVTPPTGWIVQSFAVGAQGSEAGLAHVEDILASEPTAPTVAFVSYGGVDALNVAACGYPEQFPDCVPTSSFAQASANMLAMGAAIQATGATAVLCRGVGALVEPLPGDPAWVSSDEGQIFWNTWNDGYGAIAAGFADWPSQLSYEVPNTPSSFAPDRFHVSAEGADEAVARVRAWLQANAGW